MATPLAQEKEAIPLYVKTLRHYNKDDRNDAPHGCGHYETLQKLITASPSSVFEQESAEIESCLEQFVGSDGSVLWRRVVVRSGPSSPHPIVHASYMLPQDSSFAPVGASSTNDGSSYPSVLCWTVFPDRPDHPMLCVLANPTLLCIWDVYPSSNEGETSTEELEGGEGHNIPLPFEASAIYGVGNGEHGLLLQRCESTEDIIAYHNYYQENNNPATDNNNNEDDGFILKAPPRPKRFRDSTGGGSTTVGSLNISTASTPTMVGGGGGGMGETGPVAPNANPMMIPSLFSLHHPQGDILPVSSTVAPESDGDVPNRQIIGPPPATTDVFEKILYTGVVRWVNEEESASSPRDFQQHSQAICVTYHSQKRRHAVWEIRHTPPPPPEAPLWQITRKWRSKNGWDSHLGVLQQDLEDFELVDGMDPSSRFYDAAAGSRNDALADALGVRRTTPRNGSTAAAAAGSSENLASTNRSSRSSNVGLPSTSNRSGGVSLLSPLSRAGGAVNDSHHTLEVDTSHAMPATTDPTPMGFTRMGPFASLHPKTNMTCIYVDPNPLPPAETIFLASNTSGSGTLSLCLVCPSGSSSSDNPKELTVFSLSPDENHDDSSTRRFAVHAEGSVPCIAAQPIEASPIPKTYEPHRTKKNSEWSAMGTDILLLRNHGASSGNKLSLYRNTHHVVDCAIINTRSSPVVITDLKHSFRDIIDVVYQDSNSSPEQHQSLRGRIPLLLDSDSMGEHLVQTVEAALEDIVGIDVLSLKVRADCVRLEKDANQTKGIGAEIAKIVVLSLFRFELLGIDINDMESEPNLNESSETKQGDWEQLLQCSHGESYSAEYEELFANEPTITLTSSVTFDDLQKLCSLAVHHLNACDLSIATIIFDALHLFYEEMKLHSSKQDEGLNYIGSILCEICHMASCNSTIPADIPNTFLSYYSLDLQDNYQPSKPRDDEVYAGKQALINLEGFKLSSFASPPSVLSWIEEVIYGRTTTLNHSCFNRTELNTTCKRIRSLLLIFPSLFATDKPSHGDEDGDFKHANDYKVINLLLEEGFTDPEALRDELPAGVALPLLELLHRRRTSQMGCINHDVDPAVWSLIGRDDVYKKATKGTLGLSDSADSSASSTSPNSSHTLNENEVDDKDGVTLLEKSSSMIFPDDNRIREVGRLLRSSKPIYLRVPRAIEASDHDYERQKQEKLLLLSRRVLALPLGRGMLTIGNLKPVPAEPLPLPDLCLSGRIPPTNTTMALDISECPVDMKVWPEFHNGVAAGLRLPLQLEAGESISKITRTWIVYNRPSQTSPPEPQNNTNNNTDNPSKAQDHAHGGLLMALGMRGHLTALEMTDIFDYLTHGSVTTTVGCLLGMAANMRGSCDISVSKMLCLHIPSLIPQHFSTIDVASTVQAAAVAGAGLLYEGSCHRMMTEFLLNEIGKRPSNDGNVLDREAYTLACGVALGMVNLCKGSDGSIDTGGGLADLRIEERLYRYIVGGIDDAEMRRRYEETDRLSLPSSSSSNGNERCSCVYEGDSINIDVTAPGATLALGLMFMKSGNKTIASAIALPDTHFLLEYVRPDFLMFRVISRALILWDEVEATDEWIQAQIPKAAHSAYKELEDLAERIQRGDTDAAATIRDEKDYDRQAVRYIYTHVVAAACFSIGLRFAGTGDTDAASVIFERVMELRELRDGATPTSAALRPPTPVLEMCLGCAAISLSMVLAGTGNLDALRLFKILRWPCTEDIHYGSHQAYGTAIGLLFLGGGTCTLGRDPKDIAALIMAFYPRFPSSTSDNQYHLQALRNLYALAVKKRDIKAIDVDTGEPVFAPVEVHYKNKSLAPMNLTAPCLLVNTDEKYYELRVVSKQHYPVTIPLDDLQESKVFFVKRRSTCTYDGSSPLSHTSLLMQSDKLQGRDPLELVASFTDDQRVLAFAKHFCDFCEPQARKHVSGPSIAQFCSRILNECFMRDTQQALPLYLTLRSCIEEVNVGRNARVTYAWTFRLIRSYYRQHGHKTRDGNTNGLLNYELLAYLMELLDYALFNGDSSNKFLSVLHDSPPSHRNQKVDSDAMDWS